MAGGTSSKLGEWYMDSTEILRSGHSSWEKAGKLPRPSDGIRGLTFENMIIMTGCLSYISEKIMVFIFPQGDIIMIMETNTPVRFRASTLRRIVGKILDG